MLRRPVVVTAPGVCGAVGLGVRGWEVVCRGACTATACSAVLTGAGGAAVGTVEGAGLGVAVSGLIEGIPWARSSGVFSTGEVGIGKPGMSSGEGPEEIEKVSTSVASVTGSPVCVCQGSDADLSACVVAAHGSRTIVCPGLGFSGLPAISGSWLSCNVGSCLRTTDRRHRLSVKLGV